MRQWQRRRGGHQQPTCSQESQPFTSQLFCLLTLIWRSLMYPMRRRMTTFPSRKSRSCPAYSIAPQMSLKEQNDCPEGEAAGSLLRHSNSYTLGTSRSLKLVQESIGTANATPHGCRFEERGCIHTGECKWIGLGTSTLTS